MEDAIADHPLVLSEISSEKARLAYLNYLERGVPITPEDVFEVLVIASGDDNKELTRFLWNELHETGQSLADVLAAWIQTHMDLKDPLGAFIEKIEQLKRQLAEGRRYQTLDRHALFWALTNEYGGHPAFNWKRETQLSDYERQVARKILSYSNPDYLQGKYSKKIIRSILHRLRSNEPLIDPVKVRVGEKELSYFPIVVASHCKQFHLASLKGETNPCWLSADTERFPFDLQFELLKALSEQKVGELPINLDSWKLLELAELQEIDTLIQTARERILAHTSLDQLLNDCLASPVKDPLIDFLNRAFSLGKFQEGCALFRIHCSNLDQEELSQELTKCVLKLRTEILGDFSGTLTYLIRQLPDIKLRHQMLAGLFVNLENNFAPNLFLGLINCCLLDKKERAEKRFEEIFFEELMPETPKPEELCQAEKEKLYKQAMKLLQQLELRAEDELLRELLDVAKKAGGISSTLKLYSDARSLGIKVEEAFWGMGMKLGFAPRDVEEDMRDPQLDMLILDQVQKRFHCRALSLEGVNWKLWQFLNISSFFNADRPIIHLTIDTLGRVEPEIFIEISRHLRALPNLNYLSIHGPRNERNFYCETIDLPSIRRSVQIMRENPKLNRLSLDVRTEECKEELQEYLNNMWGRIEFSWGGGGESMEFQRR